MTQHTINRSPHIYRFQISHFEVAVLYLLNKRLEPAKPPSPPPFNRGSRASGAAVSASEACTASSGAADPTVAEAAHADATTVAEAAHADVTDAHASSEPAGDGTAAVVDDSVEEFIHQDPIVEEKNVDEK